MVSKFIESNSAGIFTKSIEIRYRQSWLLDFLLTRNVYTSNIRFTKLKEKTRIKARGIMMTNKNKMKLVFALYHGSEER